LKPKEVYVEIQLLQRHGLSLRRIAAEVGCAVNTVRRHLALEAVPKYERKVKRQTKLGQFEDYLRERQKAAQPDSIPATVLYREIVALGYRGGMSQLRAFMRALRPAPPADPVVRFETAMGEQLQVDWVEFRKGSVPLHVFCATLGFSRANYVEFVRDMKVETLIACHERAFAAFGGVTRRVLYNKMKTVVLERDAYGDGQHGYHAGFLDYAKHSGFVIKLCRPYRAKTKGKVERFNGHLRRSFYVPLASRLAQSGQQLDVVTANVEVAHWLREVANVRIHGTTKASPAELLRCEIEHLQALPAP
jgi:transposase